LKGKKGSLTIKCKLKSRKLKEMKDQNMKKRCSRWRENYKYHLLPLIWKKNFKITN